MKLLHGILALLVIAASVRPCAAESGACCGNPHAKSAAISSKHSSCPEGAAATKHPSCPDAATATRGPAAGAKKCSMPYGTPCDLGSSSSAAATSRAVPADELVPASNPPRVSAPVAPKTAAHPNRTAAETPAFGPLFLAHQALML